jgi:hypothetical protein
VKVDMVLKISGLMDLFAHEILMITPAIDRGFYWLWNGWEKSVDFFTGHDITSKKLLRRFLKAENELGGKESQKWCW